jgi:carbonic anhydrase
MQHQGDKRSGLNAAPTRVPDFLRVALLGGWAGGLLAAVLSVSRARTAGETEALLLSCMDFRFIDKTERYMAGRGLREYDHLSLAGASLGALTEKYPAWNQTFWEHLDIAIQLHKIRKVLVMDHRDCGVYKVILGEHFAKAPAKEKMAHASKLKQLGKLIKEKYSRLEVELLLMSLDGKVEVIT